MPFSFKNYFKSFTGSTGSTLANLGTFGMANSADAIFTGIKDHSEFNEMQRKNRNIDKYDWQANQELEKENKIIAEQDETERLRKSRQPGRRQTLLNLQSNNSLLTGF
tara:strand:+ start:2539 stop:2862 length:324 start_codon:yes stop_codon:yes gene_type:complete